MSSARPHKCPQETWQKWPFPFDFFPISRSYGKREVASNRSMQYIGRDDGVGYVMSNEDIDLERVIADPQYRREVMQFLNSAEIETPSEVKLAEAAPVEAVN